MIGASSDVQRTKGAKGRRWRSVCATVLIVVGCVLAPLSVVVAVGAWFMGRRHGLRSVGSVATVEAIGPSPGSAP